MYPPDNSMCLALCPYCTDEETPAHRSGVPQGHTVHGPRMETQVGLSLKPVPSKGVTDVLEIAREESHITQPHRTR